jgi:hypothetical protein
VSAFGARYTLTLGTNHVVSYTSTSTANSTAFVAGTNTVRVIASTACHIKFAGTPTAASTDPRLTANVPEYFIVTQGMKVAAIRTTTSGTLHVTELSA